MDSFYDIYTHPLFRNMTESALLELSGLFKEFTCDEGAVLYYKNDGSGHFFLFLEGEFCAATADNKRKRFFLPGDYSDPHSLMEKGVYDDTLICRASGRYLKLERESFLLFLSTLKKKDFNCLKENLNLNPRIPESNEHNETISFHWRKSGFFLFERLQYPFIALMIMLLLSSSTITFPYDNLLYRTSSAIILFYAIFRLILWLAERYTMDSKNLSSVRICFSPPGVKRITLPLDQVCGIRVEKKQLKNRFFNVGNLHIQTAAGTVLLMGDLDRPNDIEKKISRFLNKSADLKKERDRLEIRKKMESHFEVEQDIYSSEVKREQSLNASDVTFRKSGAFLVAMIWWQILIIGALSFLSWIFRDSGGYFLLLSLVPFLGILLWRVQDWRNDLYKIAGGKIIDINRKPFGKSETSNLADIGFVTNVRSEKKGLFQYLFNYGDVHIETAGGSLCFETVADPASVQRRLLQMRERLMEEEAKKQRDRQFDDFLVYSEIYKQAEEQNRLNRLTPPHAGDMKQGV